MVVLSDINTYPKYNILKEAKQHPERINSIIGDAKKWGADNYLIEQLNFIKDGHWGWEV